MINFIKNQTPITICDIGASSVEETNHIDNLFNNTFSKIIGFEPNIEEYNKLDNQNSRKKFYSFAIGDGTKKKLNICNSPGMSSFLEPDADYLKKFHRFEEWSKIIQTEIVETKRLDDLNENLDFIKIDVQGYEYEIIKNGENKINEAKVIQIETSTIPLYKNEKTFSTITYQLEKLGFFLHMFKNIDTRSFKPMIFGNNDRIGLNHILQLDCVFIKKFDLLDKYSDEMLKKLILILFYSFKSYDIVDYLIRLLDKKVGANLIENYRKIFSSLKITKLY